MKIAIIGGHGKIARLLTPLLTRRGDEVTSVVRNPQHQGDVSSLGATALLADVETMDVAAIAEILRDHDAVVWSAGAGGGNPQRTYAVDRDAAIRTINAAEQAGVPRFVMVSYFGAALDHGVPQDNPFFPYAEAKAAADEHLRASALDWTIVAPSGLTDQEGTGRIDTQSAEARSVSRADVAATIAEVIEREDTHHRSIQFNQGDELIRHAVA